VSTAAIKQSQQILSWKSKKRGKKKTPNISKLKSRVNWTLGTQSETEFVLIDTVLACLTFEKQMVLYSLSGINYLSQFSTAW